MNDRPGKQISFTNEEMEAVDMALQFLTSRLKRCDITGFFYLPNKMNGIVCTQEIALALDSALATIKGR